jgi:putative sterol carrier protein
MAAPQDIKPDQLTPEQFAALVSGASDEDITTVVRQAGTADVLDRIFQGMQQRFLPDRANDVDADIAFEITDDGETHNYVVTVRDADCKAGRGTADSPKVTLTTGLVPFVKLVTGEAQGPQLFMAGKLKVSGDLMFSTRIMSFFDRPKAS